MYRGFRKKKNASALAIWVSAFSLVASVFAALPVAPVAQAAPAGQATSASSDAAARSPQAAGESRAASSYVIGSDDDPWPRFPGENPFDAITDSGCRSEKIALMFDFAATYTWETMGGVFKQYPTTSNGEYVEDAAVRSTLWGSDKYDNSRSVEWNVTNWGTRYKGTPYVRRVDQAQQIEAAVSKLKGAPVEVGIYTFSKFNTRGGTGRILPDGTIVGGEATGNTPNLGATSLATADGYQTVVNKIRSLDATNPDKPGTRRSVSENTSDWEMAFRTLLQEVKKYGYTHVFFMSVGQTGDNASKINDYARQISAAGAKFQILEMGPAARHRTDVFKNLSWTDPKTKQQCAISTDKGEPAVSGTVYNSELKTYLPACGEQRLSYTKMTHNPGWWGIGEQYDTRTGGHTSNDVRDGQFSAEVNRAFYQEQCVRVVSQVMDGDRRYLRPRGNGRTEAQVSVTFTPIGASTSRTRTLSTNQQGVAEFNPGGAVVLNALMQEDSLTPRRDYASTPFSAERPVRCTGYAVGKEPELISLDALERSSMTAGKEGLKVVAGKRPVRIGVQDTSGASSAQYAYIMCGFLSRPMQNMTFTKSAQVQPSPMGFDVIGTAYTLTYTCKDPQDLTNPDDPHSGRIYREAGDTPAAGEIANPYSMTVSQAVQTQTYLARDKLLARMPVGATCDVVETMRLPSKYTDPADPLYSSMAADQIFNSNTTYSGTGVAIGAVKGKTDATGHIVANPSEYTATAVVSAADESGTSAIESSTAFTMNKAKIKLRMRVKVEGGTPSNNMLASLQKIPVQLTCRYMPDPKHPPETLKDVPFFPGMVVSDVVGIPVTASSDPASGYIDFVQSAQEAGGIPELDLENTTLERMATFPVGTHCIVSTNVTDTMVGYDQADDGVPLAQQLQGTGWMQARDKETINSDMCAADYQKYAEGGGYRDKIFAADGSPIPLAQRTSEPPACEGMYTYLHSGDQEWLTNPADSSTELRLELVETIQRQNVAVSVKSVVQGDAAREALALGKEFPATLHCEAKSGSVLDVNGSASGTDLTFTMKAGTTDYAVPFTISAVPGDATCTITPAHVPELDALSQIESPIYPNAYTFDVHDGENAVTLTTTVNYKRAAVSFTHQSTLGAGLTAVENAAVVAGLTKTITATCTLPDNTTTIRQTFTATNDVDAAFRAAVTMKDNANQGLPYGTSCTFALAYPDLPNDLTAVTTFHNGTEGSGAENDPHIVVSAAMPTLSITSEFSKSTTPLTLRVQGVADGFTQGAWDWLPAVNNDATLEFTCAGGVKTTIAVSSSATLDTLPAQTLCTVKVTQPVGSDNDSGGHVPYSVTTTVASAVGAGELTAGTYSDAGFTFTTPDADSHAVLEFTNTFALLTKDVTINVQMNIRTPRKGMTTSTASIWELGGEGMEDAWRQALERVPDDQSLWLSYRCYPAADAGAPPAASEMASFKVGSQRIGTTVNATQTVTLKAVPRGFTCEFRVDEGAADMAFAPIPATDPVARPDWGDISGAEISYAGTDSPGFFYGDDAAHASGHMQSGVYTIRDYGKSAFLAVRESTAQTLTYKLTFNVQAAQFNVKMKVKGDGVASVLPEKLVDVKYRCRLNGVTVTSGRTYQADPKGSWDDPAHPPENLVATAEIDPDGWSTLKASRFAEGAIPNQISGLPAGALCEAYETQASAQIEDTTWVGTWTASDGPMSRGVEKPAVYTNPSVPEGGRSAYQQGKDGAVIAFRLPTVKTARDGDRLCDANANGSGEAGKTSCESIYGTNIGPVPPVAEYFYGTIVPWNDYTFNKTQLVIRKVLEGDGKNLAENDEFAVHFTCYQDSHYVEIGDDEIHTNQTQFEKTLKLKKGSTPEFVATFEQPIPVHYQCTVSEQRYATYDAAVTTAITALSEVSDGVLLPIHEEAPAAGEAARATFTTDPALGGADADGKQRVTEIQITNTYTRPRAALSVRQTLDTTELTNDNVNVGSGMWIAAYTVGYECVDQYLRDKQGVPVTYTGAVDVLTNGDPVAIKPAPNPEYHSGDPASPPTLDVPASASCTLTQRFKGDTNPLDSYIYATNPVRRSVRLDSLRTVEHADAHDVYGHQDGADIPDVAAVPVRADELRLSPTTPTSVVFTNRYVLKVDSYTFGTYLETIEGLAKMNGKTVDMTDQPFSYSSVCEYSAMPANARFTAKAGANNDLVQEFTTHQNPRPPQPHTDATAVPLSEVSSLKVFTVPEGTICNVSANFGADAYADMPKGAANKLAEAGFGWKAGIVDPSHTSLFDGAGNMILNPDFSALTRRAFTATDTIRLTPDERMQILTYQLVDTDVSELPMTGVPGLRLWYLAIMVALVAAALVLVWRATPSFSSAAARGGARAGAVRQSEVQGAEASQITACNRGDRHGRPRGRTGI